MGLDWRKAKAKRNGSRDLLEDLNGMDRDRAARWLKKNDPALQPKPKKQSLRSRPIARQMPKEDRSSGLVIYTDGACEPNPGIGGWAFVAYLDGKEIHSSSGGDPVTTNNIMEMTGVMKAIEWLASSSSRQFATIYSDSQYVVKGCNTWRFGWKAKGWRRVVDRRRKTLEPIKNAELWKELDALLQGAPVKIEWVKGHAGIAGNERADQLSLAGRQDALVSAKQSALIEKQLQYSI